MPEQSFHYQSALQDFRRARRRANLEQVMSFLSGKSADLLSYEEVRKQLKVTGSSVGGLEEIPLEAIVGSVGRYKDFTRSFLPRSDSDQRRWANVQAVAKGMAGFPPIEVYQIGDVYFVSDGNHRVSVARQLGATTIEAYVTKIKTKVSISPDIQPDDLKLKAEYADFLSQTHLDSLRPGVDFTLSAPGKYRLLQEQIEERRELMGREQRREIPYNEAVLAWYDTQYAPITQLIQQKGVLKNFPNRTLTDVYLWISEYRVTMREAQENHLEEDLANIQAKLSVLPDVDLNTLILDAEYIDFLDHTHIEEIRPGADLRVTAPGRYRDLEEHIAVHRYFMGQEQQRPIPQEEAVAHWYDKVYLPLVSFMRKRGMLRDFPNRTEADLYVWISEHRATLEKRLGWKIRPEAAAADLVNTFSSTAERFLSRVGEKMLDVVTPGEFESGPAIGTWRRDEVVPRRNDRLFTSILVPISGRETSWLALAQALKLARAEQSRIYGLHVIDTRTSEELNRIPALRNEFITRCEAEGIKGEFAIEEGDFARKICERARWVDLVVLNNAQSPETDPDQQLQSGFRAILRRCSRPVLVVSHEIRDIRRALLAYDGSRKADEALFVSAYLGGYLNIPLVVLTVREVGRTSSEMLSLAKEYLVRRNVKATFVEEGGTVSDAILSTAATYQSDLLVMGGYGRGPMLEFVLGSTVNPILQSSSVPVLICR